jgi:hypothetical protein
MPIVVKSGRLSLLEPSGPVQACNGIALPLPVLKAYWLYHISLNVIQYSTFVGPCIVIHFYSKTNQMHDILNLFYFGTTLYTFRTVSPSIIRSLRQYIQHQVHVIQVLWLLAGPRWNSVPLASSHRTRLTNTWCHMYSLRLLMTDEKTIRDM